jgi:hypothetical protein
LGVELAVCPYSSQEELNAQVADIMAVSNLTPASYTVTLDGDEVGIYAYGEQVTVSSADATDVDWFYAYQSNTAQNTDKYISTGNEITFTVRGNTTLTTKSATSDSNTVKITYVNALTGRTFATDYVEAGKSFTLSAAQVVPYYTFNGYSVGNEDVGTSITVDKDTIVKANYTAVSDSPTYTILVSSVGLCGGDEQIITAKYNDEVTLVGDDDDAAYWVEMEIADDANFNADTALDDANYAKWVDYEGFDDSNAGMEKVVYYGKSYTFRANKNAIVISLTEDEYQGDVDLNLVDQSAIDENNAGINVRNDVVKSDTKFSMIGNFVLPDDCSLVETGILFTTDTTADLTLGNVGSNGIARMKSSQHTDGNQFVISINVPTSMAGATINTHYVAYLIYKDASGSQHTVYSQDVNTSVQY